MPALICDLASVVAEPRLERVFDRLRRANGGALALDQPDHLRDDAFTAFESGRLGESEYARHVRAQLAWHGSDADLVAIFAELYGSVDVAVMELLVDLRTQGWHLVGLDGRPATSPAWGGQYAEQLTVFDQVITVAPSRPARPGGNGSAPAPEELHAVPVQNGALESADPRLLARLLREVPATHGPRLFVADRPERVAAARRSGLDGHLYRGAAGLRAACLTLAVTA